MGTYGIPLTCLFAFGLSLGFGFLLNIRPKHIAVAALGGTLGELVLLMAQTHGLSGVKSAFVAAACTVLYCEILAFVLKVPSTMYLFASLLPLFPVSPFYQTVLALVNNDKDTFISGLFDAAGMLCSVGAGVFAVSALARLFAFLYYNYRDKIRHSIRDISSSHDRSVKRM